MFELTRQLLPTGRPSIGIDWNDEYVKIVELKFKRNGRPLIQNYAIAPLTEGVVEDGIVNDERELTKVIRSALADRKIKGRQTHAVLPGTAVIVRNVTAPDVKNKWMRKWIDYELKHHIYLPFDRPVYDYIKLGDPNGRGKSNSDGETSTDEEDDLAYQEAAAVKEQFHTANMTLEPQSNGSGHVRSSGNETEILLIAASQETVKQYERILQHAGLKMKSLEIKSLTMQRFIQSFKLSESKDTFVVVDVNRTSTDFAIFHHGQLRLTRNVNIPFPDDPQSEFDEKRFRDHFTNASERLADELERLMNFFRYSLHYRDEQFQYVLISGDLKQLDPLVGQLQQLLSIDVRPLTADRIFVPLLTQQEHVLPSLVVPIGLALRGKKE